MGIFSLFGKKGGKKDGRSSEKSSSKKTRTSSGGTIITSFPDSEIFSNSIIAQRHIARATERKIDAIEFEMSRDIVKTRPPVLTRSEHKNHSNHEGDTVGNLIAHTEPIARPSSAVDFETTLPMMMPSDYLMGQNTEIHGNILAYSESVPILEEAAILYSNGQNDAAEQMLQSAIRHQNLGSATEVAWQMLFDLYRLTHNQEQFESLSLDYASKFETSPPLWPADTKAAEPEPEVVSGSGPSVLFPSKLDIGVVKTIEKVQNFASRSDSLRLDFSRIREVDPVGCGLLLRSLKQLKRSGISLMLVGAQDLTDRIRSILQVGRRDETEAPWLLLLELLQFLHLERAFEEVSMDYCVTFEVSPPSFEAPRQNISSAFPEITLRDDEELNSEEQQDGNSFRMPRLVHGKLDSMLKRITDFSEKHNPLILDCTDLERVEFSATAELLNGLAPISGQPGAVIQFTEVNYLVMMLFNAMGLKNIASITLRKH